MDSPIDITIDQKESICEKCISIRAAFVLTLLFTVIVSTVSLIATNHHVL